MKLPSASRRTLILLAWLAPALPLAAHAANQDTCESPRGHVSDSTSCREAPVTHVPTITVSATLNPRPLGEVAAAVSVIDREDMDRHLVNSLRDLVRYEPGVSVTSSPGRFGQSGFSIRGLGGNRVRIEIDGVPVSDAFSFGSMLSAGRNMVDLDSLKRVEIIRGPASSLYGSDALGGVVSYVTKDPADYLRNGKTRYFSIKGQYDSVNRGSGTSATFAAGNDHHGLMVLGTHREAHETDNKGTRGGANASRTRPDPLSRHSNNVLIKYVHTAASGRKDRVTVDVRRSESRINLLSAIDARTTAMSGKDRSRRGRISFGQSWTSLNAALADRIEWQAWAQRSRVKQRSLEWRNTGPGYQRHVEERFEQRVYGLQLHAFKHLQTGSIQHDLTWGLDASRTHSEELRDGYAINLADGSVSKDTAGGNADNYPVRDFPPTDTTQAAVFIQDEMQLAGGRVRLIPGLRIDYYRFDPLDDVLFDSQPLSEHIQGQSNHHVSPKLGVVWQFAEHFNVYGQYASGFRAPPYSDLGLLFSNLRHGYAAIPNPNLEPETSRSVEIGLRGEGDAGHFSIALYDNQYRDFIDSTHMLPRDQWPDWAASTPGLMLVFQSVNLTRARIRGAEAGGVLYLGALSDSLAGWRLRGSISKSRGDSRTGDQGWIPLDSVAPMRAVLGVGYEGYDWGFELNATAVARKDRLSNPNAFRVPGHATIDLYAHWRPLPSLKLYAGVSNLTDRHYWNWGNLHGGAIGSSVESSAVIDRYSAPGRSLSVAAKWTF